MATETVADLSNAALRCNQPPHKHKLDDRAESVVIPESTPIQTPLAGLSQNTYLGCTNVKPTAYTDVFVNDFLGLPRGPAHRRPHIRRTLFHTLDKVLRPLDPTYMANLKEVLYLKKYGDRGMHLVHLTGSPGVGDRHCQHDAVLDTTPGKPLQGDPLCHTSQLEVD